MTDWQDISTAPRDGTPIEARIVGYSRAAQAVISWQNGFINGKDQDCGAWCWELKTSRPPASWTDGVCWESNHNHKPSTRPTHWRPIDPGTSPTVSDSAGSPTACDDPARLSQRGELWAR